MLEANHLNCTLQGGVTCVWVHGECHVISFEEKLEFQGVLPQLDGVVNFP